MNDLQDLAIASVTESIPLELAATLIPTGAATPSRGTGLWSFGAGDSEPLRYPIRVPVGRRITAWSIKAHKQSNAGNTMTARLMKRTGGALTGLTETAVSTVTNAVNNPGALNLGASGLTVDVIAGEAYFIEITDGAGVAGDYAGDASFTHVPTP